MDTARVHVLFRQKQRPHAMDLIGLLKSQFLCHLVFCYVFIASGLIINTIQLFTLVLWPINKQLFRKINCRLSYCISSHLWQEGLNEEEEEEDGAHISPRFMAALNIPEFELLDVSGAGGAAPLPFCNGQGLVGRREVFGDAVRHPTLLLVGRVTLGGQRLLSVNRTLISDPMLRLVLQNACHCSVGVLNQPARGSTPGGRPSTGVQRGSSTMAASRGGRMAIFVETHCAQALSSMPLAAVTTRTREGLAPPSHTLQQKKSKTGHAREEMRKRKHLGSCCHRQRQLLDCDPKLLTWLSFPMNNHEPLLRSDCPQFPARTDCSELVMLLEWWSGTECTIYTDPRAFPKYGKENAIVVLNHKFEIDFLCGWSLAERFGVLGGSKVLAKKELAYVPIIGWMWYFTEMVFCTRKWEQDRKTVSTSLLHLRDYPEKYLFLIHCEGTRFTDKKHQISMQVAQAKGLPSLKHHLLPRTKGFAVTVRSLRNVVSAVYDCTLNFRNNENPTLLGVLNGKKYHADMYVRRIPLEDIPEDDDRCSAWLHKLYQEKVSASGLPSSVRSCATGGPVGPSATSLANGHTREEGSSYCPLHLVV
ncbi:1-acyl-sn-glycerol-3-phosphate acyltransferase delta [Tupaia chinensis]|uniref:1-acyl-sn-glycerol-3-phosphate acyltransferase delta n=1 Tax=Tupaia chinensis TaxID=246437 RepID=L9KQ15_TUPCH|nr:1-acyl-sn-glycerol-3-phosphate acyltransferase delta [Tupaia chinensis]